MKWVAPKSKYETSKEWHRMFAWRPVLISALDCDGVFVPAHWVWLERYDRKRDFCKYSGDAFWATRPYTGTKSLQRLRYQF